MNLLILNYLPIGALEGATEVGPSFSHQLQKLQIPSSSQEAAAVPFL